MFKLTGEGPFIDYSMAGRTMMLSSERPEWDSGVLDMAGISKDKLSEPVSSTATIGRVREDIRAGLGLSRTCQVVLGGHDQACGAWKRRDYAGHGDGCLRHRGRNGFGSAWFYHRQDHAG